MVEKEVKIKVIGEADAKELNDFNEELDKTVQNADTVRDALTGAFEEAQDRVNELEQALDEAVLNGDNVEAEQIAEELDEARSKADELNEAITNIDSGGLNDATSGASELSDGLGEAKNNADDLSSSMGLIEGTMMLDLANQAGQLGDQAESMAQDMNNASISIGQLATNTGIAEPKIVGLINYISNKTFPQNEAIAYVNVLNQMGVSADKLGDSATNMDRINDATGIGYQKVMLLTQGLQSMGITADNLPASFNAIAFAQANVGGGADTLQQVLKRQAGALNEYGMDVDATVVALSALQRETGLTGMKLGSEFGTRLKDCNGDLSALEQSLGLQAGALSNASEMTGQYAGKLQELADEEMEHKTIVDDINSAWEDMQLLLSPMLAPLMSVVGLFGQVGQFALSANSIITLANTFGITKDALLGLIPAQYAEGTAGWFSIGWIALAIALGIALGLALVYLWNNSEQFRNGVIWLGNTLKWLAGLIVSQIMGAVNRFRQIIQGIPQAIQSCLNWARDIIMSHPIVQAVQWLGQQLAIIFSRDGLGQRSPGKIARAMEFELDSTGDIIDDYEGNLSRKLSVMGGTMSHNFNPMLDNINTDGFANREIKQVINNNDRQGVTEVNNIFNIDYLAKKEFVQDIIDIITNEINWNNERAGRTN